MKKFTILTTLGLVITLLMQSGCANRPELSVDSYGTVVNELPHIAEAKAPFDFPYSGDTDHSKCEFNEEDFF